MRKMEVLQTIHVAVEGPADEAVAVKIVNYINPHFHPLVYIKRGKMNLKKKISAYNHAAIYQNWFVLADFDSPGSCVPSVVREWLPEPSQGMCFRMAVPQIEAWLIADRTGISKYFGISKNQVTYRPDELRNAKLEMLRLASMARRRALREDMIIYKNNNLSSGLAYTSRVIEFALKHWNIDEAQQHSDSLRRCIQALKQKFL